MADSLWAAARFLAELPPFMEFLRSLAESDMPNHTKRNSEDIKKGPETPGASFWQAAADELLRELHSESDAAGSDLETKKTLLRQVLRRAHRARRITQQLPTEGACTELLRDARKSAGGGGHGNVSIPGVTEVLKGLFFADILDDGRHAAQSNENLLQQLGVDDELVLDDLDINSTELWDMYRLFEDRVVMLFDQGRTVLAVGTSGVLSCFLYGLLRRCWRLADDEAAHYVEELGRQNCLASDSFRSRCCEQVGFRSLPTKEPLSLAYALRSHLRLLEESREVPAQRAEPLLRSTEVLLANAFAYEPRRHSLASPGLICFALLRTLRLELERAGSKGAMSSLRDLIGVKWRVGGRATLEEVVVSSPDSVANDIPASLSADILQELQCAVRLPDVLIVALEGQRGRVIDEHVRINGQIVYHTFAIMAQGSVLTRQRLRSLTPLPDCSVTADNGLLMSNFPAVVALVHERSAKLNSWVSWQDLIQCHAPVSNMPITLATKTFRLGLVTPTQYDRLCRVGWRSACGEPDVFGLFDLPLDAKTSLLQKRIASQLDIPVAWQILISPGKKRSGRWYYLLPGAKVLENALMVPMPVSNGKNNAEQATQSNLHVLVISMQKDMMTSLMSVPASAEVPALSPLAFPIVPVLHYAWVECEWISLGIALCDARRPFTSYAVWIARCIEEAFGPCAYCSSFLAYEISNSLNPTEGRGPAWRALRMGMAIATELVISATPGNMENVAPLPCIAWVPLSLAPSTTRRGLFAAHGAACLPDLDRTTKQFPLERMVAQRAGELGLLLKSVLGNQACKEVRAAPEVKHSSEADQYAMLLLLEERLLVAWAEDFEEAVYTVSEESKRRVEMAVTQLRESGSSNPPPGLRNWPSEAVAEWSPRIWERICRGAISAQTWATPGPTATEDDVSESHVWAEVATLQEIMLSLEGIKFSWQGHLTLGGVTARPVSAANCCGQGETLTTGIGPRVAHLGESIWDVIRSEQRYYQTLLENSSADEFFKLEVEDLPSECDIDIAGLNAFVQTINAELNSLWASKRKELHTGEEPQLWRAVRLRELSLSALFLLVKQAQGGVRMPDGSELEWLQHVQKGCLLALKKSQLICDVASAFALPQEGGIDAVVSAVATLAASLESVSATMSEMLDLSGKTCDKQEIDADATKEAENALAASETHTLSGSLYLLALERQMEASSAPPAKPLADGIRDIRKALHTLTLRSMCIRSRFDLPIADDAAATFAVESQRRGRKLRTLGRVPRRIGAAATSAEAVHDEVDGVAAEEAAAAQANALLTLEDKQQSRTKKNAKNSKRKQTQQRRVRKAEDGSACNSIEQADIVETTPASLKEVADKQSEIGNAGFIKPICDSPVSLPCVEPEEEIAPVGDPSARKNSEDNVIGEHPINGHEDTVPVPCSESIVEVEVQILLERGVFELLSRSRRSRLLEVERSSGARCNLESVGQAVKLRGARIAVESARDLVEDLRSEWVDLTDNIWAVLVRDRSNNNGHLSRLQKEANCLVTLDRDTARVRIAGTSSQVSAAHEWLFALSKECEDVDVGSSYPSLRGTPTSEGGPQRAEASGLSTSNLQGPFAVEEMDVPSEVLDVPKVVEPPNMEGSNMDEGGSTSTVKTDSVRENLDAPKNSARRFTRQRRAKESEGNQQTGLNQRSPSKERSQQQQQHQQQQQQELGQQLLKQLRQQQPHQSPGRRWRREETTTPEKAEISSATATAQVWGRRRKGDSNVNAGPSPPADVSPSATTPNQQRRIRFKSDTPSPRSLSPGGNCWWEKTAQELSVAMGRAMGGVNKLPLTSASPPAKSAVYTSEPPAQTDGTGNGNPQVASMSLAEQLAREFPSARIIVGAPEPAPTIPVEKDYSGEFDDRLEAKMQRLKQLLETDRLEQRATLEGLFRGSQVCA